MTLIGHRPSLIILAPRTSASSQCLASATSSPIAYFTTNALCLRPRHLRACARPWREALAGCCDDCLSSDRLESLPEQECRVWRNGDGLEGLLPAGLRRRLGLGARRVQQHAAIRRVPDCQSPITSCN
jgi:hypothetical protein